MRTWSSAAFLAAVVAFPAPAAATVPPGGDEHPAPATTTTPAPQPAHLAPTAPAAPAAAGHASGGDTHHRDQRPALVALRPVDPGVATGTSVLIARYDFDGNSSTIADESGRGHTLRAVAAHGGSVRQVVHGTGSAIAFPAECGGGVCPHVALRSPSSADLNPGTRDIAFGADVLLPPGQTSKGENIVQKGYSMTSSQWKLQVDGVAGRPSCVLVDDKRPRIRIAYSSVSIADGQWHAVQCRRAGTTLAIFVDGVTRGAIAVPSTLSVTNRRPLSIGSKGAFADNDQFNGALDNVWVQIG